MFLDVRQAVVVKGGGEDGLDANQLCRLDVLLVVVEELDASEGNLLKRVDARAVEVVIGGDGGCCE